jgi:hypothetical protein
MVRYDVVECIESMPSFVRSFVDGAPAFCVLSISYTIKTNIKLIEYDPTVQRVFYCGSEQGRVVGY